MAYFFADSFEFYATVSNNIPDTGGYWDGGTLNIGTNIAGRFAGTRGVWWGSTAVGKHLIKISGVNDAVHHINVAVTFGSTGGVNNGFSIWLQDGTTDQCTVSIRSSDGAMLLFAGTAPGTGGSPLATYPNAVTAPGVWTAFEIEVVIHNTAGSFTVRKNGNTVNDFQATGLNTRTTANNYANRIAVGSTGNPGINPTMDDFVWRSDASSVPWIGDVRCLQQMPVSDVSTQFSRAPATQVVTPITANGTSAFTNGIAYYTPFTPSFDGSVGSAVLSVNTGYTGNCKCAIFTNGASAPGVVLGSATTITNPITGNNTFTFPTPVPVAKSTQYWIGIDSDTTAGLVNRLNSGGFQSTTAYAAFPSSNPVTSGTPIAPAFTVTVTVSTNATLVNEAQQDGTTSYVYDSTVGHADLYDLADLPGPATIYAVTTRGFMAKSDAGSRSGQLQIRSGAAGTAWNPSDKGSANLVLSNGNLTATGTFSVQANVRSALTMPTGSKFYFEQTVNTLASGVIGMGIANASAVTNAATYTNTAFVTDGGFVYINGTNTLSSLGTSTVGTVIGIAVDLVNYLIWFRVGPTGNWNGNASYSPGGTGGQSISAFMTGLPAYGYAAFNSSNNALTANFGSSPFTGSVPVGFSAGFFVGTTVQTTPLVLSSSFLWNFRSDVVDPNTGSAWIAAAVNALQVGPSVAS